MAKRSNLNHQAVPNVYVSPKDEYIREFGGPDRKPSLRQIANNWQWDYKRIKDAFREQDWRAQRIRYQTELEERTLEVSTQIIAERAGDLEADTMSIAYSLLAYIRRFIKETEKSGDVGTFKQAVDSLDKLNKILRRNSGLPETSSVVKIKKQIWQSTSVQFFQIIKKVGLDEPKLRQIEAELDIADQKFLESLPE